MVLAAQELHERLVACVAARGGGGGPRGVWAEHSYARPTAARPAPRALLAASPAPAPAALCVDDEPPPAPPALPYDLPPPDEDDADDDADLAAWEERAAALAPTAAHARLVAECGDTLRALRLAQLAAGARDTRSARVDRVRVGARRLRRALGPVWARGAAALGPLLVDGPAALQEMLAEVRRALPALASRLPPGRTAPPLLADPLAAVGEPLDSAGPGPRLLWMWGGAGDERWLRRLRAQLAVRVLRAAPAPGAPDAWVAAALGAARAALGPQLASAPPAGALLAGASAGAALAAALAAGGGGGVRGLVLLGAPLHTAAASGAPGDMLADVRGPVLLVAGGGGAAGGRAAAQAAAAAPARRLLLLEGADDELRVPPVHRATLGLVQEAVDAAVVEEVVRWARELADGADGADADGGEEAADGEELGAADILQLPIVFADDAPGPGTAVGPAPVTVRAGAGAAGVGSGVTVGAGPTRVIVAKRAPGVAGATPPSAGSAPAASVGAGGGGGGAGGGGGTRPLVVRRALRVLPRGPRPG